MANRAALARPETPSTLSDHPRAVRPRKRALAAAVALTLAVTGLTATGALLNPETAHAASDPVTFTSASKSTWTVPAGVTSVTATVTGASGGRGGWTDGAAGGVGASIAGTFAVTPGEQLEIWGSTAGGAGGNSGAPGLGGSGASAGGAGGSGYAYKAAAFLIPGKASGGGGGGASKISRAGGSTLLIAGGGGGGAGASAGLTPCTPGVGGAAGVAGTGGTDCFASIGGGAGGATAANSTGVGLAGASGGEGARISSGAGGGGGGLLGGGGGTAVIGAGGAGGGGGGGSSFVDEDSVTNVTRGLAQAGIGKVVLSFTTSHPTTTSLSASSTTAVIGDPITLTVTVGAAGAPITTPAGTVRLLDADDAELGSATLIAGTASFSGILLPIDSYTVRAVFTADDDEYAGSEGTANITVVQGSTTTALSVSPAPAEFGESVTATITVAAVAPADAALDGTVELRTADDTAIASATIDASGVATIDFTPSELTPTGLESVQLTAYYGGNASFTASHSSESDLDVVKTESLLEFSQSIDTSVWGENVTLTAEVSAARDAAVLARTVAVGTVPTGTVTFYAGGIELAEVDVENGVAALDVDDLEVGTHELSASYSGDDYFTAAAFPIDSDGEGLEHEVARAATDTTLAAISGAVVGQSITLSADVSVRPNGAGTPTGSVAFMVDGVEIAATAFDGGVATLDHAFWTPGSHSVSVVFTGDTHYADSDTDPIEFRVEQAATELALASDVNPAVFGQAATVTATLGVVAPGAGIPDGEIEFELDGEAFATVPVSAGVAALPLGALAVGSYELSAHYAGDESYTGSDASITITVEQAATEILLTADSADSTFGEPLTLHAALAVTAPGEGIPTGSIAFLVDGEEVAFATLNADGSVDSLTLPEALVVGERQLTAHYAGDASFLASTSEPLGHAVALAPVGILLDVDAESIAERDTVFTATVQPLTATGHVPSGFVQFFADGKPLGAPVRVGGAALRSVSDVVTASLAIGSLPVGAHVITASYLGDGSFAAADATSAIHTVKPQAPIDPIKPIDPLEPIVPVDPIAPVDPTDPAAPAVPAKPAAQSTVAATPATGLATTGVQGFDTALAAALLLLAGLGLFGTGVARVRRRSA